MMQFNLLPDVKLEYVRTRRIQRLTIGIASLISLAALAVFLFLLFFVHIVQTKNIADLNKDIKLSSNKLNNVADLNRILTVQNQLNSLPAIYDKKPATTRLFGYIKQLTPSNVQLSQLNIDFINNKINMTGSANSLDVINTFVDTLKFTTYTTTDNTSQKTKALSDVVLTSFSRGDKSASYSISVAYDPLIFDSTKTVTMNIPSIVTTRSQLSQPDALFQTPVTPTTKGQ